MSLDLSNNGFDGPIPSQFYDLFDLIELRHDNNNVIGAISHQLSRCGGSLLIVLRRTEWHKTE
ncbi:hypothetical protein E2562_014257 [Oryza meyeriana var. granulata]|uniref:Uncharacterized protein n=1 Tax=Oryza meyeriana var. granulata TaxID=110450 RepID=A0A6G1BKL7_9ORYZ|nr:hypothetical protein E2562_014257 [Oryza meyeriana var. granulata]